MTLTAPSTIAPGGSTSVTVTTTSPVPTTGINQGGFNLSATGGQFTVQPGAQNFSPTEVGHTTAGNNQRSWTVNWSPVKLCHFDLSAASNAVDGDGLQSAGDHWNLASASIALQPTSDAAPPATPIFNVPQAGGAYLNGTIFASSLPLTLVIGGPLILTITASDGVGIDHVEISDADVGGTSHDRGAATYDAPSDRFRFAWNPPSLGPNTITAEVFDCNGNHSQATIDVFVL